MASFPKGAVWKDDTAGVGGTGEDTFTSIWDRNRALKVCIQDFTQLETIQANLVSQAPIGRRWQANSCLAPDGKHYKVNF